MSTPPPTTPQPPARLAFGPFEVNVSAGELLKSGIPVRLSGQPFQILLKLLAHPGEVVTREQLREHIWPEGTFVDFEHGLHAAINKLRRALDDSAAAPRYIETVPGRGYRFIGSLSGFAPEMASEPVPKPSAPARFWGPWLAATVAAIIAITLAVGLRFERNPLPARTKKLTRLTSDSGFARASALSPDGKLVAYSSDRNPNGGRDLYVRQIAGGEPLQLTFDGQGNTMPDFSPDGSRIVFRSDRDGGGIYEIATLGGEARLLAAGGFHPRYSPDGGRVAYWTGDEGVALAVPGNGEIWVISPERRRPERLARNLTNARRPIWSADGRHLLVVGYSSLKEYEGSQVDWWIVPAEGGEARRTGAYEALVRARLQLSDRAITQSASLPIPDIPRPGCWTPTNSVIFPTAAENSDSSNLWEGKISPVTGQITGGFRRITEGAGNEIEPRCGPGNDLSFTSTEHRRAIYSLDAASPPETALGELERITDFSILCEHASLSRDGRFLAFAGAQPRRYGIWLRELATGRESQIAPSPFVHRYPVVDASGSRVAYSSYEDGKRLIYVTSPGGIPEKVCEDCLRATDWSADDRTLLIFAGTPNEIRTLEVSSRRQRTILKHQTFSLLYARFSPDQRWVSFTMRVGNNRSWIALARMDGATPVPESDWIRIAEGTAEDWANWSQDGRTLYFTSWKDGHHCLWGQSIETGSGHPAGEPFAVRHLHGRLAYGRGGWSAAAGRFAMVFEEDKGNIWMMSSPAS